MEFKKAQCLFLLFELIFQHLWKYSGKYTVFKNSIWKFLEPFFIINNNIVIIISFNNVLLFIENILFALPKGVTNVKSFLEFKKKAKLI